MRLFTDGVDVFYEATPTISAQITAANRGGQEVLRPIIEAALRGVVYEREVAVRWKATPPIVLDPEIQFGEPCIEGTRVTTVELRYAHKQVDEISAIADLYGISDEDVDLALEFESKLERAA